MAQYLPHTALNVLIIVPLQKLSAFMQPSGLERHHYPINRQTT